MEGDGALGGLVAANEYGVLEDEDKDLILNTVDDVGRWLVAINGCEAVVTEAANGAR